MKGKSMFQTEYETKLSRVYLHLTVDKKYEEDYQMWMFRENQIAGVLNVEGCSVEGKARYTYEVGGFTSMSKMFEKKAMEKGTILEVISGLLGAIEILQEYMLNPDCLLLDPEYIFFRAGQWYFCYLPVFETDLEKSFHRLTEYFVKTLDYGDLEGIFLAYELHKATLQEHYDLRFIMEDYKQHEQERKQAERKEKEERQRFGNVFCLTEEDDIDEDDVDKKNGDKKDSRLHEGEEQQERAVRYKKYKKPQSADIMREESGWRGAWKTAAQKIRSKRWGIWDDLILESDEPPEN